MRPPAELFMTAFGTKIIFLSTAEKIRCTGDIPHWVMERVCSWNKGRLSAIEIPNDEIVEVLKSRYILFENIQSHCEKHFYFFPCLLSRDHMIHKQSQDPSHLNSLTYPPILLLPKTGYVPLGLFPAAVIKLSQSSHWSLVLFESARLQNRIRFLFQLPKEYLLDVELRALSTHLEFCIHYDPSYDTINPHVIPKCLRELRECLDQVLLNYPHTQGNKWDFGFYYPRAIRSGRSPHPARCSTIDEPQYVVCFQQDCQNGLVNLENKHKSWFTVS